MKLIIYAEVDYHLCIRKNEYLGTVEQLTEEVLQKLYSLVHRKALSDNLRYKVLKICNFEKNLVKKIDLDKVESTDFSYIGANNELLKDDFIEKMQKLCWEELYNEKML